MDKTIKDPIINTLTDKSTKQTLKKSSFPEQWSTFYSAHSQYHTPSVGKNSHRFSPHTATQIIIIVAPHAYYHSQYILLPVMPGRRVLSHPAVPICMYRLMINQLSLDHHSDPVHRHRHVFCRSFLFVRTCPGWRGSGVWEPMYVLVSTISTVLP